MQNALSVTARAVLVAAAVGVLSACATVKPEQLAAVEAKVNSAMSEARAAASAAKGAMDAANAASQAAARAQSTADAAMACCGENKDRIERMFEQTMRK